MVLALITLLAAMLVGLLVKFLFLRTFELQAPSPKLKALFYILIVIGAVLTFVSTIALDTGLASRKWPTASGRVISSEMVGGTTYRPQIVYEYKVGGEMLRDTSDLGAPGFGGKRKRYEVATASIKRYQTDSTVTVHYDPADPRNSSIRLSLGWDNLGKLGLGLTLIIGGLVAALSFQRKDLLK